MTRLLLAPLFILCDLAFGQRSTSPNPKELPCEGHGGAPAWSLKVLKTRSVRFTIDAHLIDTCTEYYDLEFLAEFLNAKGSSIEVHRFTAPGVTINGPTIRSFDFMLNDRN